MQRLHFWNRDHVRTPYEYVERLDESMDISDPRSVLLQSMIATSDDAVVANTLNNHDETIEDMTSWFEALSLMWSAIVSPSQGQTCVRPAPWW